MLILLLDKYLQKRIITSPVVPELNFSNKDMYCLYYQSYIAVIHVQMRIFGGLNFVLY